MSDLSQLPDVSVLLAELADFATAVAHILPQTPDWQQRPKTEAWNLTEVMCHLRDVEREVHQPRFRAVLTQENAFLPGVSSNDWAVPRQYAQQDGTQALQDFLIARQETQAMLQALSQAQWTRKGNHAFLGPTSMHELLWLVVKHDQQHRRQLRELLSL